MAKVLVVDDRKSVREATALFLKAVGHQVSEAADGKEALAKMLSEKFDFILTDLEMPGMNGDELTRRIKNSSPETRVAIYTGSIAREDDYEAKDLIKKTGAEIVFIKPIDNFRLDKVIRRQS